MPVLEEVESPINGKIVVLKNLGLGTYIQVEGLTQSGGVVSDVWQATLKKVKKQKSEINNCLILGLGGGSAAALVKRFWPEAKITGVEIDPIMVELGKKYLNLPEIEMVIGDADRYCRQQEKSGNRYDLILIDVYLGYEVPKRFQDERFGRLIKNLLTKGGIAVFNRLYFGEKRALAMKFGGKLEKIFPKMEAVFPEANVMFVCSD